MFALVQEHNRFSELRRRLIEADPEIDETTLLDTLEGATNLGEAASAKKREVAQAVMEDAGIEKILEPDFTVSLRVSPPGVAVVNEADIPEPFWIPQPPKLDRKGILDELKSGRHVPGATFTNSKVSLAIRSK